MATPLQPNPPLQATPDMFDAPVDAAPIVETPVETASPDPLKPDIATATSPAPSFSPTAGELMDVTPSPTPGITGPLESDDVQAALANAKADAIASGIMKAEEDAAYANTVLENQKTQIEMQQKSIDDAKQEISSLNDQVSQERSETFWGNKSTGQKIGAAIGIALAGIGQGMLGTRTNAAMDVINREKDRWVSRQSKILDGLQKRIERLDISKEAKEQRLNQIRNSKESLNARASLRIIGEAKKISERTGRPLAALLNTPQMQQYQKSLMDYNKTLENRSFQRQMGERQFQQQKQLQDERLGAQRQAQEAKAAAAASKEQVKEGKKKSELYVPGVGLALNKDDAKKLKESKLAKEDIDRKLDEMIKLREKYGAEVANRAAVARGKQLSKDLLLQYKNLAKLGVLSQADQDIIEAIIPGDPLAVSFSLGGENPILNKLKSLRSDVDKKWQDEIRTRTSELDESTPPPKEPPPEPKPPPYGKIVKQNDVEYEWNGQEYVERSK